ncbi:hypothetical protein P0Y35_08835 [Kiritimatiellaeota bacterium B1221]|nr:hypothetical protein [Kiritimatiellaeota bacterium B1221]
MYLFSSICSLALFGQAFPDPRSGEILDAYAKRREVLVVQKELSLVKLKNLYHEALASLEEQARAAGDFENYILVEAEIKRSDLSMVAPEKLSSYAPLENLQKVLVRKLAEVDMEQDRDLLALYKQLDQALVLHQRSLLKEGNIEGAKNVQILRADQRADPEVARAIQSSSELKPPPAQNQGPQGFTFAHAQKLLKGNVKTFNPVTREIEVAYDFESKDQLQDFLMKQEDHFKIEKGTLVITTPPHSDWSFSHPQINCPYLVIPYLEAEDVKFQVDLLSLEAVSDFHVAIGISDFGAKTFGLGPLSVTSSFTAEGWTPDKAHARAKPLQVPLEYPATLSFHRSGKKIEFAVKAGRRDDEVEVDTDPSLINPGFYPKSWGSKGTTAVYDRLVVRGRLKPDFGK